MTPEQISAAALDLGFAEILRWLAGYAHTAQGDKRLKSLALAPDLAEGLARHATVAELRWLRAEKSVHLSFAGIADIRTALERVAKGGVLSDEELIEVAQSGAAITCLRRRLAPFAASMQHVALLAEPLVEAEPMYKPIQASYGTDCRLVDHASPELGNLRRRRARLIRELEDRVSLLVETHKEHLQDNYFTQREGRYVVPVRSSARGQVAGIVHGTSQSGQSVFIEPAAVVDIGNRLRLAECALADEEDRIRARLSALVLAVHAELTPALAACVELDVWNAVALFADQTGGTRPQLIRAPGPLKLFSARHPLIVLAEKPCVANDIIVEAGTLLVVSGANAGGKTVALKTAGLTVLMARAGIPILCKDDSIVPWFEQVFTDIGDAQSLADDLSTFSAHMNKLCKFLRLAGQETLVLLDEVAVGTEPEQGAALAQAILEALAERGASGVVTTHYDRLKQMAAKGRSFANASVGFDFAAMHPTFALYLGSAGSSFALAVARKQGLPAQVLERAELLVGEERASFEHLLAELAAEHQRAKVLSAELTAAQRAAEQARAQAELARQEAKETKKRLMMNAHEGALAALRDARTELENARKHLQKRRSERIVEQSARVIDDAAKVVQRTSLLPDPPSDKVPAEAELKVGAEVFVVTLSALGTVVEPPWRGRVTVQVGGLKTSAALANLRLPTGSARREASVCRGVSRTIQGASFDEAAEQGSGRRVDATIDLRGLRVESALDKVDKLIDRALLAEYDELWLVHGHGTGALRKAIRAHLGAHPLVARTRPGERREGGDGVTVAYL